MIRPRLLDFGHPDRPTSAEEMVEPAYQQLVARMVRGGLSEDEVALAIESLAQAHLETIAANAATDAEIAKVRHEAGLPPVQPAAAAGSEWMPGVGGLFWCLLVFCATYLLVWALL